jgi:hypothetical protein
MPNSNVVAFYTATLPFRDVIAEHLLAAEAVTGVHHE